MHVPSAKTLATALSLLALVLVGSAQAFAQGFYYKEIEKDGRIYVFNNADRAEAFEKTGEMGIGITQPGVGPKGETVVGDSERALQLFFFKHGISEAVPEPAQPVQRIEWRDGKTRITTDLAYLEISNRIMVRYTHEDPARQHPARLAPRTPATREGRFESGARSSSSKGGSGARTT